MERWKSGLLPIVKLSFDTCVLYPTSLVRDPLDLHQMTPCQTADLRNASRVIVYSERDDTLTIPFPAMDATPLGDTLQ